MYFHGVKSTAHPPIMGTLGHSTDFIKKRPNTAVINIYLHSCQHFVSCWKRNSGLKQKQHLRTIKHTGIRKCNVRPSCLFLLPSGHQLETKSLGPSGHQMVTKWSTHNVDKNVFAKEVQAKPSGHHVVTSWSPSGCHLGTLPHHLGTLPDQLGTLPDHLGT